MQKVENPITEPVRRGGAVGAPTIADRSHFKVFRPIAALARDRAAPNGNFTGNCARMSSFVLVVVSHPDIHTNVTSEFHTSWWREESGDVEHGCQTVLGGKEAYGLGAGRAAGRVDSSGGPKGQLRQEDRV